MLNPTGGIEPRKQSWLVVIDLDGLIFADPQAVRRFALAWPSFMPLARLVYASGRFYDSVTQLIEQLRLPEPEAIIGGVGTEIRLFPGGKSFIEWQSRWWSSWSLNHIREALEEQPDWELQPEECQSEFKRSYFVHNAPSHWLQSTRRRLMERRTGAEVLYSSQRDLDILPTGAGKGEATEFLARAWKIPRPHVIVAGDSANALSLFMFGYRGILVADAQRELQEIGGANVYRPQPVGADGVLDGLKFWVAKGGMQS